MVMKPKLIKLSEADIVRFWGKVDKCGPDECWEWQAARNKDYGWFRHNGSTYFAHRVAFVITNGDVELCVLHTCNNPPCCNPKHLYAGTLKDNAQQCFDDGRGNNNLQNANHRGEKNSQTKLTESDVHEIRRLYTGGWLQREIAGEYDIHQSGVSRICRDKQWKHV